MTLQQRIRQGQRRHEREILRRVRAANREGALWTTGIMFGMTRDWKAKYNAIDRLAERGKIVRVLPRRRKNGRMRNGGWKLAGFNCPGREWKECDAYGRPPSKARY